MLNDSGINGDFPEVADTTYTSSNESNGEPVSASYTFDKKCDSFKRSI